MTREEIIEKAKKICFSSNSQDYIQFVEQLPANLDKAAEEYDKKLNYYEWVPDGINKTIVEAFKAGAKWMANKDKLTWEDINEMSEIMNFMIMVEGYFIDCERDYKEVLKRFKEYKEQKNK